MKLRKRLLLNTRLYLIVCIEGNSQQGIIYARAQKALKAGIKILQLRCKTANDNLFLKLAWQYRILTKKNNALFIINDRVDIAHYCGADGVHLGQDNLPLGYARKTLGPNKIYGKSTHSLKQARQAQLEGADYIGFGPIFQTQTKPWAKAIGSSNIKSLVKNIKIPFFAIGGINENNIGKIISAGAERVAISNAILSKENTTCAVKSLERAFQQ